MTWIRPASVGVLVAALSAFAAHGSLGPEDRSSPVEAPSLETTESGEATSDIPRPPGEPAVRSGIPTPDLGDRDRSVSVDGFADGSRPGTREDPASATRVAGNGASGSGTGGGAALETSALVAGGAVEAADSTAERTNLSRATTDLREDQAAAASEDDTPPSGPSVTSGPGDDRRRYRRRRWRRNRYPGPIPTPDEWEPPEGPVRIGLQVGHWKTDEAPRELSGLRGGGTRWGSTHEWQVNHEIATRTQAMLEELGYEVDLLPAVVPPGYRAHLFIAIHADGSNDSGASGFRVAAPRRDATGRADQAVNLLERTYGEATGLPRIAAVTRRMRSYYAFNFRRYEHALHPMTIAVIIETGFLTNGGDRRVIVDDPDRSAHGIVEAVKAFSVTPPPDRVADPQRSSSSTEGTSG